MNKRQAKKKMKKIQLRESYIIEQLIELFQSHTFDKKWERIAIFSNPGTYKLMGIKRNFKKLKHHENFEIDMDCLESKLTNGDIVYLYKSEKIDGLEMIFCKVNYKLRQYLPIGTIKIPGGRKDE